MTPRPISSLPQEPLTARRPNPRDIASLDIRERNSGVQSAPVAEVLIDYAKLLRKTNRGREADRLEARARAIRAAAR